MIDKIKGFFYSGLGIGYLVLWIVLFIVAVLGLVSFYSYISEWLPIVNTIVSSAFFLLLFASLIPRARAFSGNSIVVCSYVFGVILWLNCFAATYAYWGATGVFIGAVLLGVGIFLTGALALLFNGEFIALGSIILSLVIIYGIRLLGYWITSKYSPKKHGGEIDPENISISAENLDFIDLDKVIYCEISPMGAMGNEGGILIYLLGDKNTLITYETNESRDKGSYDVMSEKINQKENLFINYYGGMGNYVYVKKDAQLEIDEKNNCFWYHSRDTKLRIDSSVKGVFLSVVAEMRG